MQLFIPPLGFELELAEDWHFSLHEEHRNEGLLDAAGLLQTLPNRAHGDFWQLNAHERVLLWNASPWRTVDGQVPSGNFRFGAICVPFVFRAGTRLKVERIYIRQGQTGFDSVTFRSSLWVSQPGDPLFKHKPRVKSLRFWAKLGDANTIRFKPV